MISKKKIKYTNQNKYRTKKQRGGLTPAEYETNKMSERVKRYTFWDISGKLNRGSVVSDIKDIKSKIAEKKRKTGLAPAITIESSGNITNISIKNLYDDDKTIKNSVIDHISCHGVQEDKFSMVPNNTIICFTTPLSYVSMHNDDIDRTMRTFIDDMNFFLFKDLFQLRSEFLASEKVTNIKQYISQTMNRGDNKLDNNWFIFDTFRESNWYYPGNLYPDLSLGLKHEDWVKGSTIPNPKYISKECSNKSIGQTNIIRKQEISKLVFPNISEQLTSPGGKVATILSEAIDRIQTQLAIVGGFRLIIVTGCREFNPTISKDRITTFLKFEMYIITKNAWNDKRVKDKKNISMQSKGKNALALSSSYSYRDYLVHISDSKNTLRYSIENNYSGPALGGKVLSLHKIYKKKEANPSYTYTDHEYNYISTFSLTKILLFFQKPANLTTGDEADEFTKFLDHAVTNITLISKINKIVDLLVHRTILPEINIMNVTNFTKHLENLQDFYTLFASKLNEHESRELRAVKDSKERLGLTMRNLKNLAERKSAISNIKFLQKHKKINKLLKKFNKNPYLKTNRAIQDERQGKIILYEEDIRDFENFPDQYKSLFASIEVKNDILEDLTKGRGFFGRTHINKFSKLKTITVKLEPGKINNVKLHKLKTLETVFVEGGIIESVVVININLRHLKSINCENCTLNAISYGNKNFDTLNIVDCTLNTEINHVLKNIKNISLVNCIYDGNLTSDLRTIRNSKLEEIKLSSMDIGDLSISELINNNPNLNNIDLQNIESINQIIMTFKTDYVGKIVSMQKMEKIIFNFSNNDIEYENLDWLKEITFEDGMHITT